MFLWIILFLIQSEASSVLQEETQDMRCIWFWN